MECIYPTSFWRWAKERGEREERVKREREREERELKERERAGIVGDFSGKTCETKKRAKDKNNKYYFSHKVILSPIIFGPKLFANKTCFAQNHCFIYREISSPKNCNIWAKNVRYFSLTHAR